MSKNFPRILVCPLDWGIGHATRCVPVIKELLQNKVEVMIGGDGMPLDFLSNYFPYLPVIRFPGFPVRYPSNGSMAIKMALQAPQIFAGIKKEHRLLQKIIKEHSIDAVISDNRFGLWSESVYSIYITHQVAIKPPEGWDFLGQWLPRLHGRFIRKYDECWIPDYPGEPNLSGELGHPPVLPVNALYAGPLSRFRRPGNSMKTMAKSVDILIMLSGPEPQRSILERLMLDELAAFPGRSAVILRGLPGRPEQANPLPDVTIHNHLGDEAISELITHAGMIICRPGYSTLMDLAHLGRSAVLIATPGQTEQEYLAQLHSRGGAFYSIRQSAFSLAKALDVYPRLIPPQYASAEEHLLEDTIHAFLARLGQSQIAR